MSAYRYEISKNKKLTSQETKVANLVIDGHSNKRIAHMLEITEGTVKAHLTTIFKVTNNSNRIKFIVNYYKTGSFYRGE